MCEPISLGILGAVLGTAAGAGAVSIGAGATGALLGAAASGLAGAAVGGLVGKKSKDALGNLLPEPVTPGVPKPIGTPTAPVRPSVGGAGASGFGAGSGPPTLLTGSRGSLADDSLLGRTTLLGG